VLVVKADERDSAPLGGPGDSRLEISNYKVGLFLFE
jgi:hypothetical protein